MAPPSPYSPTSSYFGYQQSRPLGMTGAQAVAASTGTTRPGPPRLGIGAFPGKLADDQYDYGVPGWGIGANPPAAQTSYQQRNRRMVSPDYSGILGAFTADARNRFGAGLAAQKAQRLSRARAAINKLGIRDPNAMLGQMAAYGLTAADLQGARDNPWSELKALDYKNKKDWANYASQAASQGMYRSGATTDRKTRQENERARNEAMLTQQTLSDLSEGLFGEAEWERSQRDAMEQAIAQQQTSLAAAYQPYWIEE